MMQKNSDKKLLMRAITISSLVSLAFMYILFETNPKLIGLALSNPVVTICISLTTNIILLICVLQYLVKKPKE